MLFLLIIKSDEDFPGHVGLFEPKTDFAEDHGGVMVAHSVSPTYGGKTTIQLINPTPVPVTLYSQEKIGKLSFLQEADTVRLVNHHWIRNQKCVQRKLFVRQLMKWLVKCRA